MRGIMTIRVIQQTTAERKAETKALFEQVKPMLDNGYSFRQALIELGYCVTNTRNGRYRDLVAYAKTQGYNYNEYKWRKRRG